MQAAPLLLTRTLTRTLTLTLIRTRTLTLTRTRTRTRSLTRTLTRTLTLTLTLTRRLLSSTIGAWLSLVQKQGANPTPAAILGLLSETWGAGITRALALCSVVSPPICITRARTRALS